MNLELNPEVAAQIRWSSRGSCGNAGCTDPECCCSLCGEAIGLPEDDPAVQEHLKACDGCELCDHQVPLILFRGEGKAMQQAQFCNHCFEKLTGMAVWP